MSADFGRSKNADNQREINGRPAWRVLVLGDARYAIEPFFGKVRTGEFALTTEGLFIWRGANGWTPTAAANDLAAAVLRTFLDAKVGADNQRERLKAELDEALELLQDVFCADKGMREDEWVAWCNENLDFMHEHGRLKSVVGYS